MKKNLFLLGGHDLEMMTIKQLLIDQGYQDITKLTESDHDKCFADKSLRWGAKITDYADFLEFPGKIYGVELSEPPGFAQPSNFQRIDHHNQYSHLDSSLEQVAAILGIKLNGHQKLVAANDKGYIPAMKAMGASDEEISNIRKLDRKAQGVSDQDEKLAEESIARNLTRSKGVVIVKSLTSRFSPITDRLYPCNNQLIYTDNELTFYGQNALRLRDRLPDLKKHNYFGGSPENGFWGLSGLEITQKLINEIIDAAMTEISHHIFMFPFKVEEEDRKELRKKLKDIKLKGKRPTEKSVDDLISYNEKKYFHEFAHAALSLDDKKTMGSSFQYEEFGYDDLHFSIEVKYAAYPEEEDKKRRKRTKKDHLNSPKNIYSKIYTLRIEKASLQKNKAGVGLLSVHLSNTKHEKPKDILFINQYGRRLFPPFFDLKYEDFKINEIEDEIDGTMYRVLSSKIGIYKDNNLEAEAKEDWSVFKKEEGKENQQEKIQRSQNYVPIHIDYFLKRADKDNKPIDIVPILDDRMFVMSWFGSEQLNNGFEDKRLTYDKEHEKYGFVLSDICKRLNSAYELGSTFRAPDNRKILSVNPGYNGFGYANNDFWYQYLFLDAGAKMCQNPIMQQQLVEERTYARWIGYNTLFGVSRYSFVMLTSSIEQLKKPGINAAFLVDHLKTIYFRMVSLCLMQRSMLLVYDSQAGKISGDLNSDEISEDLNSDEISEDLNSDEKNKKNKVKKDEKDLEILMKDYTEFLNCVFHREITPQEQGIELYDMLQKHLRIEYQAKELEREIDELHRNADLISSRKTSKAINKITIIGGALLLPTFIASMAQVGLFDYFQDKWGVEFHYWLTEVALVASADSWWLYIFPHGELTGTILLCAVLVFWLYRFYIDQDKEKKRLWQLFGFSAFQFVVFIAFYSVLHIVKGFTFYLVLTAVLFIISLLIFGNKKTKNNLHAKT